MGRCVSPKSVSRYLDGDLGPAAAQQIQAHLVACSSCRRVLEEMTHVDEAVRAEGAADGEAPDVSARVVAELRHHGAFARARMSEGRRRVFGEGLFTARMAASLAAAAVVVGLAMVGSRHLTHEAWAERATPVVADARRVLVQLVAVDMVGEQQERVAVARETSRKLDLSQRLAQVRSGANSSLAADLSYLESTFNILAAGEPLPDNLQNDLRTGEALARAERVMDAVNSGG